MFRASGLQGSGLLGVVIGIQGTSVGTSYKRASVPDEPDAPDELADDQ